MSSSSDMIGPVLPSHLQANNESSDSSSDSDGDSGSESKETKRGASGIGPCLPPGFKRQHEDTEGDDDVTQAKKSKTSSIGPTLPPGYAIANQEASDNSESDDDVIGPALPSSGDQANSSRSEAEQLERRAQKMRQKLLHPEGDSSVAAPSERETWMTQLPRGHELTKVGVMPQAKTRFGDGKAAIDHSWTLAPGQKPEQSTSTEEKPRVTSRRDQEMAAAVAEYDKSRRAKSLLEMHQKKIDKKKKKKEKKEKKDKKKKKKKEKEKKSSAKPERRPFDRDEDLKANVFDDAKKKALIKKSQVLNSRFGHGGTQFL